MFFTSRVRRVTWHLVDSLSVPNWCTQKLLESLEIFKRNAHFRVACCGCVSFIVFANKLSSSIIYTAGIKSTYLLSMFLQYRATQIGEKEKSKANIVQSIEKQEEKY